MEDELEGGGLRVVEAQDPREQDRPELGHSRADRGTADTAAGVPSAEVEQLDGEGLARPVLTGGTDPGGDFVVGGAGLGQAGQISLDVGEEHRHARAGQALGQELERAGLTGTGSAGHQRVPVEQPQGDAHGQSFDRCGFTPGERVEVGAHRQRRGGETVARTHLGGVGGLLGARGLCGRSCLLGLRRGLLLRLLSSRCRFGNLGPVRGQYCRLLARG